MVGSSPRLIAAPYVLLRLLVPRHPPCALINLATKMLASTVQFSRYGRPPGFLPRTPLSTADSDAVREPRRPDVVPRVGNTAPSGPNSVPTAGGAQTVEVPSGRTAVLTTLHAQPAELVSVPPLSSLRETFARDEVFWTGFAKPA